MRFILAFAMLNSLIGILACLIATAIGLLPLIGGLLAMLAFGLSGYYAAVGIDREAR